MKSVKFEAVFASTKANGKPSSRPVTSADVMPFGKHKGLAIEAIPRDYLVWCLKSADVCNPDSDRYWPEFKELCESLVGPHAPVKPPPMGILELCDRLRREGITLGMEQRRVVTSQPVEGPVAEAIRIHTSVLGCVLERSGIVASSPKGSARLILAVEMRAMVKAWFSKMSRRFHPDTGGSVDGQIAVNQGYKALIELVNEWEVTK